MSLRRLSVSFVLLSGLALAGCATTAPPAEEGAPRPDAGAPQAGGVFYQATASPPEKVHPHADNGLGNTITLGPVYETLIKYDYANGDFRDQLKLVPKLAESWEVQDPQTFVFHLRKGVKFHDGAEMTSADVAWSLEFLRDQANKFRRSVLLQDVEKIEALDRYTVRITARQALAGFLNNFNRDVVILPKQAIEGGLDLDKQTDGTGPFKLVSWDRGSGATLVRNDGYWMPGRPYLDKIQLFYGLDPAASSAAFTVRKNDVVKVTDKAQFDAINAANPDAWGESFPQDISDDLVLKLDRPPFNDLRVRRAVHLALDRQEMMTTVSFGLGNANPPGMNGARKGWSIPQEELLKLPGYDPATKQQDIAEAKRLLGEAGYGGGLKVPFKYNSGYTRYPAEAQVVAAQLLRAGIEVTLDPRETATAQKAEADGDFVMNFAQFRYQPDGPDWPFWLHSKQAKARTGVDDPELDRLIDSQYRELDETRRRRQWLDIQRLLLEKLYVIGLTTQVGFVAYQPYAHGWSDNYAGQAVNQTWETTWVEPGKAPAGR